MSRANNQTRGRVELGRYVVANVGMTSAIIVAASKGTRMGPDVDKLFLELNGCPVVAHTWRRFDQAECIDEIVLVVRDGMQGAFTDLAGQHGFRKPFRLAVGGKERQDSVWSGLEVLSPAAEIVAIQDAARPCTSADLIAASIAAARETGAAVAAQAVTDTIKESCDGRMVDRTLDRARLWAVQTPQTFRVDLLMKAYQHVEKKNLAVTDEASAVEAIGESVYLVPASWSNIKITTPADLALAATILKV